MLYLLLTLLLIVVILSYIYVTRNFNYWKDRNVSFVRPIPYFGNCLKVFLLQKNMGKTFQQLYSNGEDKSVLGIFVLDEPCLLIRDLDTIKHILVKDFQYFDNRSITQNMKDDPVGSSMLSMLPNPEWHQIRKKVTVVYSSAKIKAMHKLLVEASDDLVASIKSFGARKIDIYDLTQKFATDVISSTAFGIKANSFTDENSEILKAAKRMLDPNSLERAFSMFCYFLAPTLVKIFKMHMVEKQSKAFLEKVFWKVLYDRKQNNIVRNDIVDILKNMKDSGEFDNHPDSLIIAQALVFFVAGHDTLSATIAFLLFELAANPNIQDQLRAEIFKATKEHLTLDYDILNNMEYLEMCLKETLRKYPIVPFLDRKCNTHYNIPNSNITIEPSTTVFVSVLGLHFDENFYPDPEKFNPLRFNSENIHSIPACAFLPFGEGPRGCIGIRYAMETLKVVAVNILSQFEVKLACDSSNGVVLENKGFLMVPKDIFLTFKKIEK